MKRAALLVAVTALPLLAAPGDELPQVAREFAAAAKAGDLSKSPIPDFSYAGYRKGTAVPAAAMKKVFSVSDYGAIPDDGNDDIAAIQKAIDAAEKAGGGIVQIPKGVFDFNVDGKGGYLVIRASNITIRGEGTNATTLYSHHWHDSPVKGQLWMANSSPNFIQAGPVSGLEANKNGYRPPISDPVAELRPARQFSMVIEAADAARLKPGTSYMLTQFDPDGTLTEDMAKPLKRAKLASGPAKINTDKYYQIVGVEKVAGNRITLDAPTLIELRAEWKPVLREMPMLREVGVEKLRLKTAWKGPFVHHKNVETDDGWNHIRFDAIEDGFVREVVHEGSTTAVMLASSKNCTISDSVITGPQGHNGWSAIGASTYNLVTRCDAGPTFHQYQLQGAPVGNVFQFCKGNSRNGIDCHGGLGIHNLFDALDGPGSQHGGSGTATPPRIGRGLVLWNWNPRVKVDDIMPGTVVVGGSGTTLEPKSLYDFQRKLRLGLAPSAGPQK